MIYNTEKRAKLIEFFKKNIGQALTAEEICNGILDGEHGKSTVYRLISKLVDDGSVRRISDAKTRKVTYQYIVDGGCSEHLHLKCKDCGILIHLDEVTSHILETRILKSEGFTLDGGALIYGRCEECSLSVRKAGTK